MPHGQTRTLFGRQVFLRLLPQHVYYPVPTSHSISVLNHRKFQSWIIAISWALFTLNIAFQSEFTMKLWIFIMNFLWKFEFHYEITMKFGNFIMNLLWKLEISLWIYYENLNFHYEFSMKIWIFIMKLLWSLIYKWRDFPT